MNTIKAIKMAIASLPEYCLLEYGYHEWVTHYSSPRERVQSGSYLHGINPRSTSTIQLAEEICKHCFKRRPNPNVVG